MKLFKRLFIPDCHTPFYDARAFSVMMDIAREFRPDEIVILGDFFDCYSVSDYTKDPEKNFNLLEEELDVGRNLIRDMWWKLGKPTVVFIQGNHEHRIDRYIATYAGKLGGLVNTKEILKLPEYVKWIPYGQKGFYRCGKLIATHGSITSRHVCAAMASKYGVSVIFGHTHRIQEFNIKNVNGERIKAVTCGWLGDLERAGDYVQNVADWSHGFAIGYFKPASGEHFLQVIEIHNGEAVWDGKLCK